VLCSSSRITCPAHLSRLILIYVTISLSLYIVYNSSLHFILHSQCHCTCLKCDLCQFFPDISHKINSL
jgi:hypothetical protein